MPEPATDHRRATAERNAAAILDATERLLHRGSTLTMAAVAAEAGVSRPTLYAHHPTLSSVVEAAVARAVDASVASIDAARPDLGPPGEALDRMLTTSWDHLAGLDALARAANEHLPPTHGHRTHAPLMTRLRELVDRGQLDGSFRTDLPAEWLVTMFYALVHGAADHVHAHDLDRADVLPLLTVSAHDLFAAR